MILLSGAPGARGHSIQSLAALRLTKWLRIGAGDALGCGRSALSGKLLIAQGVRAPHRHGFLHRPRRIHASTLLLPERLTWRGTRL